MSWRQTLVQKRTACALRSHACLVAVHFIACTFTSTAAARPLTAGSSDAPPEALARQLLALSPGVHPDEASRLAAHAYSGSRQLAGDYRPVASPHLQNFLVNVGLKKRGLCHHWARDLGQRLARLKLRTLVLRWGIARAGTLREHNCVVVTARGQPFERGIVLDAWRHSGRLFSGAVASDRYPWKEDPHESFGPPLRKERRETVASSPTRAPAGSGGSTP